MALSRKERRAHQKVVMNSLEALVVPGVVRKERRTLQKTMMDALAALKAKVDKVLTRLDELLAGKFTHYDPVPFIELVEDIVKKEEGTVDQIKQPVIDYYKANMAA